VAIGNDWSSHLFDGPFFITPPHENRPSCSLVFVESADGNTGASDPESLGGGDTDKHLIYEGLSRVAADAVLAGAETMRSGNMILSIWHPQLVALRQTLGKPRHPVQIVASLRGIDLDRGLLYNVPDVAVIIVTVAAAAASMDAALRARPWIRLVTMDGAGDLRHAFTCLRGLGIQIVSCIGGRTLARGLFENGLVDDLYLTTAPRHGGEPNTPLQTASWRSELVVRKRGTDTEAGVVFAHMHARA
jgi:riboflavin biosynthesis pyrimidine reductase